MEEKKIITYKIGLFKLMMIKMMPLDCNKMYSNLSVKKKTRSYILRTDIQNFYVHHETDIQQNIVLKIELRHGDKERETKTTKQ